MTIDTNKNHKNLISDFSYFIISENFSEELAKEVINWIIEENLKQDKKNHLKLLLNSNGGDLYSAFAICDMMKMSKIPIYTYGLGSICSSALLTFMNGAKGHRYITNNTSILSHQYSTEMTGKHGDFEVYAKEMNLIIKKMVNHYISCTGLSVKVINQKLLPKVDVWLSVEEAIEYNIADHIIDCNNSDFFTLMTQNQTYKNRKKV